MKPEISSLRTTWLIFLHIQKETCFQHEYLIFPYFNRCFAIFLHSSCQLLLLVTIQLRAVAITQGRRRDTLNTTHWHLTASVLQGGEARALTNTQVMPPALPGAKGRRFVAKQKKQLSFSQALSCCRARGQGPGPRTGSVGQTGLTPSKTSPMYWNPLWTTLPCRLRVQAHTSTSQRAMHPPSW